MQLIHTYPIKIEKWDHPNQEKFLGNYRSHGLNYMFGISPQDINNPTGYYFNVGIEKKFDNQAGIIFYAKTTSTFLVSIADNDRPTPEFFFDLVNRATHEFSNHFYQHIQNTNLRQHKIEKPRISDVQAHLTKCFEYWDRNVRYLSHN